MQRRTLPAFSAAFVLWRRDLAISSFGSNLLHCAVVCCCGAGHGGLPDTGWEPVCCAWPLRRKLRDLSQAEALDTRHHHKHHHEEDSWIVVTALARIAWVAPASCVRAVGKAA